ncbi:MAG TPA: hypothetical protein VHU82_03395 [Vicinamibacterales bacterium]|jgi:hypothetical protein|nr:hypothetical protein [Vicinamibacterales bacterium]
MKAAILTLVLLLPVSAAAQNDPAPAREAADAAAQPATPTPPAPSQHEEVKRRGSMVGYIDDASVDTQIRLRFDAGFHDHRPDQAEFFYGKCGCYRQLAGNAAYDPNAPGPGPGIATDINFQQFYVEGQYSLMGRVALFAELPVRWLQPQAFAPGGPPGTFSSQAGLSDIRAGGKVALVNTADTTLTAQVTGYFPSGDAKKGLGTNHSSVEPALLYFQRVADRVAIESQIADWHPIGGSAGVPVSNSEKFAGDVIFYGIGPSFELVRTSNVSFAPVVELVGWHVVSGFSTVVGDVSGANIVNLKVGARTTFQGRSSFYVGYGRALTQSTDWYDDILRLEYRFSF